MGWGKRKSKKRRGTLVRDLNYVHPVLGPFYLPAGTQVILPDLNKVVDNAVVDAYKVLRNIGTDPVIIEVEKRYYLTSRTHVNEGNSYYGGNTSKFRRNR